MYFIVLLLSWIQQHSLACWSVHPYSTLTLYWKNGKVATTDGPYAETKEQLGGILVLEARDMNHAVQLMAQHPALEYGSIFEIRPTAAMSDVMKASEQRRRQNAAH